jgi:hypothetical protein
MSARITLFNPDNLSSEARAVHDRIVDERGSTRC